MAKITIRRPAQPLHQTAVYSVLLDDEWAGSLLNNDRLTLQVSAGNHYLQVSLIAVRRSLQGNVLSFSIDDTQSLAFECGSEVGFFDAFFRPWRPLSLRQISSAVA